MRPVPLSPRPSIRRPAAGLRGLRAPQSHSALQSGPMHPRSLFRHRLPSRALAAGLTAVTTIAILAACSNGAHPVTSSASNDSGGSALSQALKLAPSDTGYLSVTDWEQV